MEQERVHARGTTAPAPNSRRDIAERSEFEETALVPTNAGFVHQRRAHRFHVRVRALRRPEKWASLTPCSSLLGSVDETIPRTANEPPAALVGHGIETPTPTPARLTLSTMFLAKAFIQFKRARMRQGLTRLHDEHFAKLDRR